MMIIAHWNYPTLNQVRTIALSTGADDGYERYVEPHDVCDAMDQRNDACWIVPGTMTAE